MGDRTFLTLLLIAIFGVAACSGGGSSSSNNIADETDNDNGDDNGNDNGVAGLMLGSGEGGDFEEGVLAVGMGTIAHGGSTGVSGRLITEGGEPVEGTHEVEFSSDCVDAGEAQIATPRTVEDGEFTTTYTADGCSGADLITAEVEVDDNGGATTLTASATVEVETAELGSVAFIGADPDNIGLRGMGGVERQETAVVQFQVRNEMGTGIPGYTVAFSLSTEVGDIQLIGDEVVTSDADGMVSTTVKSGTVATPVRVNARIVDTQVGTQSDRITISTGIPESDGVSLSAECWNVEGLDHDGVEVELTMRLRDRFSNPVVDGTQVQFSTEGGRIEADCLTAGSECSVTWTSQNPRPVEGPNAGRSAVLAYLIGEESFTDETGDGLFGQAEIDRGTLRDLGEPFRDDTESGQFDPGQDGFFFDYDNSGDWTGPNNRFDGVLCGLNESEAFRDAHCGGSQAAIGAQGLIIMSGSTAFIELTDGNDDPVVPGGTFDIDSGALTARVFDVNDNPMACDTEITMETTQGEIQFGNTLPIGGGTTVGGNSQTFFITGDEPEEEECGLITISVETPRGVTTNFSPIEVCEDGTA